MECSCVYNSLLIRYAIKGMSKLPKVMTVHWGGFCLLNFLAMLSGLFPLFYLMSLTQTLSVRTRSGFNGDKEFKDK